MSRPYTPSNGTEGADFMETWCVKCVREPYLRDPTGNAKGRCRILSESFVIWPKEPKEWIQDDDWSNPRCTAFKPLGERSHKRKGAPKEQLRLLEQGEKP
jgi:hypothetical protein